MPMTTEEALELQRVGFMTLTALFRAQVNPDVHKGWIDTNLSIEVLLTLVAAVIETMPEAAGQRALRLYTKAAGERINEIAKGYRKEFEASGQHMIEVFGGMATPGDQIPRS